MSEEDHYLYIVGTIRNGSFDRPVKVGITKSWRSRLKMIQTGSAERVDYVWIFNLPDKHIARQLEAAFHETQNAHRMSGEWFAIDPLKAVQLMCMNIRAALAVNLKGWSEPDLQTAYELTRAQEAWDFVNRFIKENGEQDE